MNLALTIEEFEENKQAKAFKSIVATFKPLSKFVSSRV